MLTPAPARVPYWMVLTLALISLLSNYSIQAYERLQGPTELLFCDTNKALQGYTLFGVGNRTFLLDLQGRVVHTWPVGTNPHLLDNGNIVDASKDGTFTVASSRCHCPSLGMAITPCTVDQSRLASLERS